MLEKKELLDVPVEGDEERDLTWLDLFLGPKLWQDSRDLPSAGAELIKVTQHLFLGRDLPIQHLFLCRDHQLQRSVYPTLLISFLKEDESFQSTQSTVRSLIPSLCQPSHVAYTKHTPDQWNRQASKQSSSACKHWLYLIPDSPWVKRLLFPFLMEEEHNVNASSSSPQGEFMSWPREPEMWLEDVSFRVLPLKAPQLKTLRRKIFIGAAKGECWCLSTEWGISKFIWNSDASTKTHMETGPAPSNLDDHGDRVPSRTQVSDRRGI